MTSYTFYLEVVPEMMKETEIKTALLVMKNIFDDEKLEAHLSDYFSIAKIYYEEEKGLKFLEVSAPI
ncbi:MAG TPA: hypothetical protein DHW82_09975 [Spirochaetia bacterium]|nr:MAG: hypothetical protein A2Y41_08825 [Spirochaetes bacterium GWB1_36_13]HCL57317.1 hypothetical protein [Spirochaetia bacterium]